MKVDPGERPIENSETGTRASALIIGAVLVFIALLSWLTLRGPAPTIKPHATPETSSRQPEAQVPATPDAPDISQRVDPEPAAEPATPSTPQAAAVTRVPITLENSDLEVRAELEVATPPGLYTQALEQGNLIERAADLVAGGHRGYLMNRAIPLPPPQGTFQVRETGELLLIDPVSYGRYDRYVEVAEAIDTAALVDAFHRFRPLLEQAYGALGYPPADFDNALLATLDLVLATPVMDEPQGLKLDVTTYLYADPALEALPALQKQLIRMGPDNLTRVQVLAARWRAALLRF